MRHCLLLLPLLFSPPALACINDRDSDSLALQAQNFPDTLRVITGRFERNPPLFYEMRIGRSLNELKKNPRDFGLYDDIGAAYDRLHKSDQALQIMEKKRALLPPFDAKDLKMKEAWYRYFANAGTFRAHRFLSAKPQRIEEMQKARAYIKRAIEIKPDAHFGREKYQLMAMDWILAVKTKKNDTSFSEFLILRDGWEDESPSGIELQKMQKAAEGLSGLIVLGAGWQSVDIFEALAYSLKTKKGITVSHLAYLRTQELLGENRKSLVPKAVNSTSIRSDLVDSFSADYTARVTSKNQKTLQQLFPKLRAEADAWAGERTAYMLARLQKGDHPDTNPKFWADWKPAAPPSLEVDWIDGRKPSGGLLQSAQGLAILGFGTLFSVFLLWLVGRSTIKRRRNAV